MKKIGLKLVVAAIGMAVLFAGPVRAAENPCNPCGGAKKAGNPMPAVNPDFAKGGTVFHVNDANMRDSVTFRSEAPLEDIVGVSNAIGGYVVFDPADYKKGLKAEFAVSVASLNTGIPLRDEHLHSEMWLNATAYPEIGLKIDGSSGKLKSVRNSGEFDTYEGEFRGTLTLKGKQRQVDVNARLVYMKESDKTKMKMPGNLLAVRASFSVPLKDFGITGPPDMNLVGTKVSDTIEIEVSLIGTTAMPAGDNPCNPCGKNKK